MDKKRKGEFLILRVDSDFKKRVVKKARDIGKTVSELVRDALNNKL